MPINIVSGFKKTNIYSFNWKPFIDEDFFLISIVTDRHVLGNKDVNHSLVETSDNFSSSNKVNKNN